MGYGLRGGLSLPVEAYTWDGTGRVPGKGDWLYDDFDGAVGPELIGDSFTARAYSLEAQHCLHGPAGHGLMYYLDITRGQAPVPRGAFNPAFDRKFKETYSDPAILGLGHEGSAGGPQDHSFGGSSQVTIQIKAVTEKRWDRKDVKYRENYTDADIYS